MKLFQKLKAEVGNGAVNERAAVIGSITSTPSGRLFFSS